MTGNIRYFLYWILLSAVLPLYGNSSPFRSDTPFGGYAEMKEPLSVQELSELSLLSSGLAPGSLAPYIRKIENLLQRSESVITSSMSEEEKGDALLNFLHENLFRRYVTEQTRIDVLLDRGTYNCVSSAVIYMIITRYYSIPVIGILTEDHAFCHLPYSGSEGIDVETTTLHGFDPGSRKEFQSSFSGRTGYTYVPPGNYSARQEIGDLDMAGLILKNRIVELQKRNRQMEALTLAADHLALTGSDLAREDYYSSLQNAASYMNSRGEYQGGIDLLTTAAADEADFPSFLVETRSQLVYNAVAELLNSKKLDEADDYLFRHGSFLKESDRVNLELQIASRYLEQRASGPFNPRLIEDLYAAQERGVLTKNRAASMAAYHYSIESQKIAGSENNTAAYLFYLKAPEWIQSDREYRRIRAVLMDNTAIEYHNRVVQLLQDGREDEAAAVLEEGLQLIPSSSLLRQDKRKIAP